jgi:DNA-binding beta-propeller fold protein YncE
MKNYEFVHVHDKAINTVLDTMPALDKPHGIELNQTGTCLCAAISPKSIIIVIDTSTGNSYTVPLEKVTVPGKILLFLE